MRQIYVRSTARVYEIYTNDEYLCTVRCGVATRDGEVLRSNEIGDDNVRNEDDWVEVKADDANSQTKPNLNLTTASQDLFEATAEINDANPCISLTLRLLSLQSKGSVWVDEIYVFGDPVDSEIEESHNENLSGSSLMAMFLPSLLQASKTTGLSSLSAVRKEKQFVLKDDLKETPQPSACIIENQLDEEDSIIGSHEVELKEVKGGSVGPSQSYTLSQAAKMESGHAVPSQAAQMDSNCRAIPSKVAEMENNRHAIPSQVPINQGDFSGGNVERALEKLMSRMDRIEEICLGFQEKMVVPMNSIEVRLQRVEQQLETLSMKRQNSELPSCYKISAPDASFIESDTNSCENCLDCTVTGEIESDKKSLHTEVLNVSPQDVSPEDGCPENMSESESTTQLLPGLVVTAPEFPEDDDEEDNASEQEINPSNDIKKKSIDDALSSSLANFSSSSLTSEVTKYTKSLHLEAPEFSNEDADHESSNMTVNNDLLHPTDNEEFSHIQVLASSTNSSDEGEKVSTDSKDKSSEKTAPEAEQWEIFCSAQGDQDEVCVDSTLAEPKPKMDFNDNFKDEENGKISDEEESDVFLSNLSNISNEVVDNQTSSGCKAADAPKNTFHDNIMENFLGFLLASPVVDYEIPLLDVKFTSQTSSTADSFLESLLVETPGTSSRDPSVNVSSEDLSIKEQLKGNGSLLIEEHSDLISVDDGELVNPASNTHFAVVEDLSTSITAPVNVEGDFVAEEHKRKRDLVPLQFMDLDR